MRTTRPGRRLAVVCAITVVVIVAAFALGFGIARGIKHASAKPAPPRPSLPAAVGALTAAPNPAPNARQGTAPTAGGVRRAIARLATAPGLGGRLLARVVDASSGKVLFDSAGNTPAAPASTGKLLTAAAILA